MPFQIGDKVVYPNQGVGIVEQISTRNLTGQPEMFYLLRLTSGSMRVIVPISSVVNVGLRRVSRTSEIGTILDYLQKGQRKVPRIGRGGSKRIPRRCGVGRFKRLRKS